MARKTKTKLEKLHMSKVASLGCIICGNPQVHLHHIRYAGLGMGKKSSHYSVIPLCQPHHQGNFSIHNNPKEFTEKYGTQQYLLERVLERIKECETQDIF